MINSGGRRNYNVIVLGGSAPGEHCAGALAEGGLDWLNKGVFISVAGRQAGGVIYETYLVG